MRYQLLSRLKRVHIIEDDQSPMVGVGMMDDDEAGLYLEFDGPVHDDTSANVLFIPEGPPGTALGETTSQHYVNYIPERAKVIARRICPCILEWMSEHSFRYASIAIPQLSGFFPGPKGAGGRHLFYRTQYGGEQWARFEQRAIDVEKFIEDNGYGLDRVYQVGTGETTIRPKLMVKLDDDLRYLLKLKFTRPSVDR